MQTTKLLGKHYYSSPKPKHNTGDIWKNLPTLNLLKTPHCSGVVITPACDLTNSKVETVTFLPIISVQQWFCSRSLYQPVRAEIMSLCKQYAIKFDENYFPKNYLPKFESFKSFVSELNSSKSVHSKKVEAIQKIILGLELLENIIDPICFNFEEKKLNKFLGDKRVDEIKEKVIKNSYSSDLHFLPIDEQNIEWSAVSQHSVVLFRYPITIPIEIFDLASDIDCTNWELGIDEMTERFPYAIAFKEKRPLKSIQLKQEFLSDLLTRYVSLYVRIGSTDFSKDIIDTFKNEI